MDLICENCGTYLNFLDKQCPLCGHANKYYMQNTSFTPQTISELKDWYESKGLGPYESTRFFIGIDYKRPKAFGIYETNGIFTVYKNKADGSRAIRYEGPDEAFAVNELYLKLKEELIDRKYHRRENVSLLVYLQYFAIMLVAVPVSYVSRGAFPTVPLFITFIYAAAYAEARMDVVKKMHPLKKVGIVSLLCSVLIFSAVYTNTPRYYKYYEHIICSYQREFYLYNESENDYARLVKRDNIADIIKKSGRTHRLSTSSSDYKSQYSFKDSNYYKVCFKSDYSSDPRLDHYDDYSSSSDSYSTDWDSDW